jgi:hypothetical protein
LTGGQEVAGSNPVSPTHMTAGSGSEPAVSFLQLIHVLLQSA